MSETTAEKDVFVLNIPTTLTFPNLLEAKAVEIKGKPSGEPKFSANFEFAADHQELKALKDALVRVAKARWPGRALSELAFPISDGTKLADKAKAKSPPKDREFSRGKAVLISRSKFQPKMSIISNGKLIELEDEAAVKANIRHFYSGVQAIAQFALQAYDGVGNNPDGVTAYLDMVLSTCKGEKLTGSGQSAAEVFKGYVGVNSTVDPTAGTTADLDDEIPF